MSSIMQELLAQSSFDKLKEGAIVPGVITEIRQNEVVVDIGGKSEGVIPAHEFVDIGELQIGSTIEVSSRSSRTRTAIPSSPSTRPSKRRTGITS
jgi:small subunit ribosomal protein S1